jgi:hypothetical protein
MESAYAISFGILVPGGEPGDRRQGEGAEAGYIAVTFGTAGSTANTAAIAVRTNRCSAVTKEHK